MEAICQSRAEDCFKVRPHVPVLVAGGSKMTLTVCLGHPPSLHAGVNCQ